MKTLILLLPLTLLLGSCSLLVDFKEDESVKERNCDDQLDNDGDGFTDCDDQDCENAANCATTNNVSNLNNVVNPEDCGNLVDDNDDGLIDCQDPECFSDPNCSQLREICGNGIDDDDDGAVDCEDPDCVGDESCPNIQGETDCGDGLDNDGQQTGDGLADCLDPDCTDNPICADTLRRCNASEDYYWSDLDMVTYYQDIYQLGQSETCIGSTYCGIKPEYSLIPYCYPDPTFGVASAYQNCDQSMACGPGLVCAPSEVNPSATCLPLCAPGYNTECINGEGVCFLRWMTNYDNHLGRDIELWACERPQCSPMASVANTGCGGTSMQCIPAIDLMGNANCHPGLGTVPIGDECNNDNECMPGSICRMGGNEGSTVCHRLCIESTTCGRGSTCFRADNRQRFGFCQ